MAVYLLHFDTPYKHARHYLGYSSNVERRLAEHQGGHGVPLTRAAVQAQISLQLARLWEDGDRTLEKRLRNRKKNPRLCPICQRKEVQ